MGTTLIARVVVDVFLDREFDYTVPLHLRESVKVGSRVTVPFGKRTVCGYVIRFLESSDHPNLKAIESVVGDRPFLSENILRLTAWMADYYCSTREQAVRTVLPGAIRRKGQSFKVQQVVSAIPDTAGGSARPTDKQKLILDALAGGSMPLAELLERTQMSSAPVHSLAKKGMVKVEDESVRRDPLANKKILRTEPLALTLEQSEALRVVLSCLENAPDAEERKPLEAQASSKQAVNAKSNVTLLYGVTGSGKTEVYLQAIDSALTRGYGAIVLVPEISLTPQTVERFVGRFGNRVAVLHSHLSDGERHDEWHRILEGKADIVIGARSAVFAPVRRLGLIVVDEEHEPSYKQDEAPRYNARDVAVMRGHMEGCAVVLGSATPSLESWVNASNGKYRLAVLAERADNRKLPGIRIIDMRIQANSDGKKTGIFSQELLEAIRRRLDRAEQVMLFLNRRGFATSMVCPKCGFVAKCDHCSVSYTFHKQAAELRCHICGARKPVPPRCPGCKDPAIRFAGVGTQRVEEIIRKCFPQARVQRMDADITRRKDSYERIFGEFRTGKIDILVGTQMIAKGLHFPNVTLVGVVYADLSLHMPDFRAGERTFQLLCQVAGRAGRGEVPGEVMVQTFTPHHPAVQAARRTDFQGFADQESEFRRELHYPPFYHLTCITLRGISEEKTRFHCEALAKELQQKLDGKATVSDAAPAPLARAQGYYRFQIMIRSKAAKATSDIVKKIVSATRLPTRTTCTIDVDALDLL